MSDSEDYGDGYGSDLMGYEADRAKLAAMTELDREMELLERSDRRVEIAEKKKVAKKQKEQQEAADKVGFGLQVSAFLTLPLFLL